MTFQTNSEQPKKDDFDALMDAISTKGDLCTKSTEQIIAERKGPQHPCEQCAGTGEYHGKTRYHKNDKPHCFACAGRGWFKSSKETRQKNRVKSSERKRKSLINSLEVFEQENPGIRQFLSEGAMKKTNTFLSSLNSKLNKFGELTEKQLAAARRLHAGETKPQDEKEADVAIFDRENIGVREYLERMADSNEFCRSLHKQLRDKGFLSVGQLNAVKNSMSREKELAEAPITLNRLVQAFLDSSRELKWPKLRLQTEDGLKVVLSRAGERSSAAGSVNVTDGRRYAEGIFYGRITPDGRAVLKKDPQSVIDTLTRFNADPNVEIKAQGLRTGQCCCCGRELTDPESVANGIGPICAENWGF